ncbi:MAG: metal ABC transporter substrate-binding protein [Oscillospiraceae bacterium]|nr:metal ABC transporter substrate-binding protein [Oscillospiraceae bacterium]
MKKKRLACLLAGAVLTGLLAGCTNTSTSAPAQSQAAGAVQETGTLKIVSTIFPPYDWVRSILGGEASHVELTMLLDNGVDLHSYQPTADDMIAIAECDLFLYVGGESDAWVEDALANAGNEDRIVINLMEALGGAAKEEELREGMQEDEHALDAGAEAEEEAEYDEHIWLSLRNAETLCTYITAQLSALDAAHAAEYEANCAAYLEELQALDQAYLDMTRAAPVRTVLFCDRFPFRYLVDDYELDYYAAFAGCSAETEASFETVAFLAEKIDALGLEYVLVTENSDRSIAETVIGATAARDQEILALDSMQSVTTSDLASTTYLSRMEGNLDVLRQALS